MLVALAGPRCRFAAPGRSIPDERFSILRGLIGAINVTYARAQDKGAANKEASHAHGKTTEQASILSTSRAGAATLNAVNPTIATRRNTQGPVRTSAVSSEEWDSEGVRGFRRGQGVNLGRSPCLSLSKQERLTLVIGPNASSGAIHGRLRAIRP